MWTGASPFRLPPFLDSHLKHSMADGILHAMISFRTRLAAARARNSLVGLMLPLIAGAQSTMPVRLDDPDLKELYPLAQKVQVMGELCLEQAPQNAAGVSAALTAWNAKHARPQLDSLINATFKRRAALGRSLIRSMGATLFGGDVQGACSNFAAFLSTAEHDLAVSNLAALQSARRKLGVPAYVDAEVAVASTGTAASPALPPATQFPPVPPDTTASAPPRSSTSSPPTAATLPEHTRPDASAARVGPPKTPAEQMRERMRQGGAPAVATETTMPPPASLTNLAPPRGWTRKAMSDGSTGFTVTKPDSGTANLVIGKPEPLAGLPVDVALRNWLRSQLASRLKVSFVNTVSRGRTVHGNPAAWADETADFLNSSSGLRILGIAIAQRDNTFTPVLMLTKEDSDQYHYVDDVREWFSRITLPGDVGPTWSPQRPSAPGPLQGLWFGTQLRSQFNIYGGMDMIAARTYIAMYRNGFAYRELPDGGRVDEGNAAELCVKDPTDCGTYRVEPNRIVFDWKTDLGLVETDTAAIQIPRTDPLAFEFDGVVLSRISPVTLTRLAGEFTSIEGSSSGPNGSISLVKSITFDPDGRYQATSAVGFTSTPGVSTGSETGSVVGYNPNIGPNRGTYEIVGYTLTMRPENGPVRRSTIIFFDDQRPVTSVLIDDNYYKK